MVMASNLGETYEWVELLDPKSQRTMYVNLDSGECCWEAPQNRTIKPLSSNQWWELFDVNAQRNYYYNSITRETVWQKPANGDIIPLANLQLLQQNMQSAPTTTSQDIGVLRRSNSKTSDATGNKKVHHSRKTPVPIIPEGHPRPDSDVDHSSRTDPTDGPHREEHKPRRTSIDPINLAAEQFHRLSTQNTGTGYRPYGSQRVRDWLREAGVAWENPLTDGIDASGSAGHDGSDKKNTGCFSDRPARRMHNLTSPNSIPTSGPPTDHSSPSLLTPGADSMTLESVEPGKLFARCMNDNTALRSGSTKTDSPEVWNADEFRTTSDSSRVQRDLRSLSGQADARKSLPPSYISQKADSSRSKANPECDVSTPLQPGCERADGSRENNQSKYYNGQQNVMLQMERGPHPAAPAFNVDSSHPATATRQRAFPRTNPTVSRPAPGGTTTRSARFSATTLDRPVNTSYTSLNATEDQRNQTGSVHRGPAFNVVHFSNTDLRVVPSNTSNGRNPCLGNDSKIQSNPQTSFDNPSSPSELSHTLSNQASAPTTYHQSGLKASLTADTSGTTQNGNSPAFPSPHPSSSSSHSSSACSPSSSSSSSSSFSRASSGTALTNTDSEEHNKHIVHSAPNQILDSTVPAFSEPRRASLNQDSRLPDYPFQPAPTFPIPASDKTEASLDSEQPPIPPPRSASTLGPNRLLQHCTSDFYRLAQGGMFVRSDPYAALAQRPYALYYPRYPHYMGPPPPMAHLDGAGLINDGRVVSSLSRKDPARANVIPPNHRRPPPFVYQQRPAYPLPGHTTIYYVHPFDGLVHEPTVNYPTGPAVCSSTTNHRLSSTSSPLLPSAAAELCSMGSSGNGPTGATSPSTATTWVSHSTATWDLEKLRAEHSLAVPTSEGEFPSQPPMPAVQILADQTAAPASTGNSAVTTTTPAVLTRSPSGGFIGPEELNDSVWFSTADRDRLSAAPPVPLFTLVQPGHPQFPTFIAPFDWPRTLFKPDQDVVSLMSWTKSAFSKRLLVSTEPNMKKQVADTFKIVQSFMGDRKARLSLPDYGSIIVHRALNTVGLRDEIFAQLCKQTTSNPDIKSLTNGWALICVCLHYFPPNSKFRDALLAYLNARSDAAVSLVFPSTPSLKKVPSSLETAAAIASGLAPIVSELKPISNGHGAGYHQASTITSLTANRTSTVGSTKSDALLSESSDLIDAELPSSITASGRRANAAQSNGARQFEFAVGLWDRPTAAHFARVAPRWFVRALNVGPRKLLEAPSIEEICHVKDFILKPSIFGGTLTEMMRIQAYRFPNLRLPWIQIFLTEELLRLNGPVTEGVFRLSPDLDLVTEIRCQLEKLFEIFRVVHVCALDSESANSDDQQHPPECFRILRPPPAGWSASLREFETEPLQPADDERRAGQPRSAPILANSVQLTGAFTWPLSPVSITSPPSEYVLLTPTDQWPRSLSSMASRLSNTTGQVDPHLAAGLLKLWLREMADPLIPVELQPECLKAALEAEAFESQHAEANRVTDTVSNPNPIHECCQLVRKIPPLERRSLLYLILLLQHLAKRENSSRSLMDPRNLATVIAPNLMRSSSTNPRDLLENIRPQTLFVRLLISYLDVDTEYQHLLTSEQRAEDELGFLADGTSIWSRGDPGSVGWSAPIRVRLGPDNGLLPA